MAVVARPASHMQQSPQGELSSEESYVRRRAGGVSGGAFLYTAVTNLEMLVNATTRPEGLTSCISLPDRRTAEDCRCLPS